MQSARRRLVPAAAGRADTEHGHNHNQWRDALHTERTIWLFGKFHGTPRTLGEPFLFRCRLTGMWRLILSLLAAACLGGGCGQMAGDCSGGSLSGSTCVNTQVAVHWTDARATAVALAFDYAPVVRGRLTQARCRIVARFPAYEAKSVCKGKFEAPNQAPRRVVVAFSLSGIGAVNPDCASHWKSSPYCSGKNHMATSGG
jgi:hypothetical protein